MAKKYLIRSTKGKIHSAAAKDTAQLEAASAALTNGGGVPTTLNKLRQSELHLL
jgi:hypothetical protein